MKTFSSRPSTLFAGQDGKLNLEEFILAMHLCEMGQKGEPLPDPLPINLVPPSLRRTWQGQQNGSAAGTPGSVASQPGAAGGNRLVLFLRSFTVPGEGPH